MDIQPDKSCLIAIAHRSLEHDLKEFYNRRIKPRMFFYYHLPNALIRLFSNPLHEKVECKFEYTMVAIWDQKEKIYLHGRKNGPDFSISLPWMKETRGFPQEKRYTKDTPEMKIGKALNIAIIKNSEIDNLMFMMHKTEIRVDIHGDKIKIRLNTHE